MQLHDTNMQRKKKQKKKTPTHYGHKQEYIFQILF